MFCRFLADFGRPLPRLRSVVPSVSIFLITQLTLLMLQFLFGNSVFIRQAPRCQAPRCQAPRCQAPRCQAPQCFSILKFLISLRSSSVIFVILIKTVELRV